MLKQYQRLLRRNLNINRCSEWCSEGGKKNLIHKKRLILIWVLFSFFLLNALFINSAVADDSTILGIATSQSLEYNAELDSFSFSLSSGESIFARMSEIDGALDPEVKLQGPDGSILTSDYSYYYDASFSYPITQTGTYTVFSGDHGGNDIGDYGIYIQNLKNPKNAISVDYGTAYSGSLDVAEMDAYVCYLDAGDSIYARMSEVNGALNPFVKLYSSNGTLLTSDYSYYYSAGVTYTVSKSGNYVVLAGDYYGTATGKYGIYIQNLKNPENIVTAKLGTAYVDSIDVSEFSDYVFYLDAGDTIYARTSEGNSSIDPAIKLFSFDGTLLTSDYSYYYNIGLTYTVSESGNYLVLSGDHHGTNTGKHGTCIQKINNPTIATSPRNDQAINASLEKIGEVDNYYFSAYAGQTIRVRMSDIDPQIDPMIKLFNSSGGLLTSDYSYYHTAEVAYNVVEDDKFTVLAGDHYGTNIGNYSIYFHGIEYTEIQEELEIPVTEIVVVTTAAVGASIIGLIAGTGLGKYKFLSFLSLLGPLYLKTVKEDVFNNEKRLNMYNHIAEHQPVVYSDIKKSCNLSHGEINWHAQMMTQLGIIRVERKGFNVFFKIYGKRLPPEKFVRLTDTQKSILDLIKEKPGISQKEIVEKLNIKQQNISYNIKKLKKDGKVRIAKEGKTGYYYPTEK